MTKKELKSLHNKANNGELVFINGYKVVSESRKADAAFIYYKKEIHFVYFRNPYESFYDENYEEDGEVCELHNDDIRIVNFFKRIKFLCFVDTKHTNKELNRYDINYFNQYLDKYYKVIDKRTTHWYKTTKTYNHTCKTNECRLHLEGFYYRVYTDYSRTSFEKDVFNSTNSYYEYNNLHKLIEITKEEFDFVEECYNKKEFLRTDFTLNLKTDKWKTNL